MYECTDNACKSNGKKVVYCFHCVQKQTKKFNVSCHDHPVEFTDKTGNWNCSGSKSENKCYHPGNWVNTNIRFKCSETCNFDLCEWCVVNYNKNKT